ncbi:unnamed protein product [Dicrocoelium dendriticum]|nr:unnamed protein product [Dicrocoelium dendriticum]
MEWFGGLSSIKDQIGNLTKDLLSDGLTEEESAKTGLNLCSSHIKQLQSVIDSQKLENSVLTNRNNELEAQLESSLFLLEDLRHQLTQQQAENQALVSKLRAQTSIERGEPEGQSSNARSNATELASEDYSCFGDAICEGTADWEALCDEVSQLRAEAMRWRQLAKKIKSGETCHIEPLVIAGLEEEIEDLKQQLVCLDNTRRAEVAAERERQREHLNSLDEQLQASKIQIELLRGRVEQETSLIDAQSSSTSDSLISLETDPPSNTTPLERFVPNCQRISKKKGPTNRLTEYSHAPEPSRVDERPLTSAHCEVCTQTESSGTSTAYDNEGLPPYRSPSPPSGLLQTQDIGIQVHQSFSAIGTQTCFELFEASLAAANLPSSSSTESESLSPLCGIDVGSSRLPDICGLPSQSHLLEDFFLQLAEDMQSDVNALVEIVSNLINDTSPPSSVTSNPDEYAPHNTPNVHGPSISCNDSDEVTRKVDEIRENLKCHCERILAVCKEHASKTSVINLKKTINELKERLCENERISKAHILDLETTQETSARLQRSLVFAVRHLMSRPLSSWWTPPSDIVHPWPPTDPEAQLNFLISSELAAYNQLKKLHISPDNASEALEVPNKNSDTRGGSTTEEIAGLSAKGITELAHQLCASLDEDFCKTNWDPEEWDAVLYALLKPRFLDPPDAAVEYAERLTQLSAEVTSLQEMLNQHDLRQLLSTMTTQKEQIESLSLENRKMREHIAGCEQSVDAAPIPKLLGSREESGHYDDLEQVITAAHHELVHHDGVLCNSDDVVSMLKCLLATSSHSKSRAEQIELMYSSVVSALQEKHSESQAYHSQLQQACAELQACKAANQSLQQEVSRFRKELTTSQTLLGDPAYSENGTASLTPSIDGGVVDSAHPIHPSVEEAKLLAEISRLQSHLIEIEESYTSEALNAESREVTLREKLAEMEMRLQQEQHIRRNAEDRVCKAERERDAAKSEMEKSEQKLIALESNLANLQSVLESFQQNQQAVLAVEMKHLRSELERACQREAAARREADHLAAGVRDRDKLTEEVRQLSAQIELRASELACIQNQVAQKNDQIGALRSRLAQMAVDVDSKIDKVLVKNLIISYLQLPPSHRQNGVRVIGSLLQFTEEDYAKVGSDFGSPKLFGWIQSAMSRISTGPPKDVTFSSKYPDKSFTELLLTFLEEEAGERVPLRLSMDSYAPHPRPVVTQHSRSPTHSTQSFGLDATRNPHDDKLCAVPLRTANQEAQTLQNPLFTM